MVVDGKVIYKGDHYKKKKTLSFVAELNMGKKALETWLSAPWSLKQ